MFERLRSRKLGVALLGFAIVAWALVAPESRTHSQPPVEEFAQTFASDCTTPKTIFARGETVCGRLQHPYLGPPAQRRFEFSDALGYVRQIGPDVVIDDMTSLFPIPSSPTTTLSSVVSSPNEGTFRLASVDNEGRAMAVAYFTVARAVDLSVSKTDGVNSIMPGGTLTYTISAINSGPEDAVVTFTDTLPAQIDQAAATWTCTASNGAGCSPSGSGNIAETFRMPVGGIATYTVIAPVRQNAAGTISNTATMLPTDAVDVNPLNNSATDNTLVIPPSPTPSPTPSPGSIAGNVTYGTAPPGPLRFVPGVLLTAAGSVPANATTDNAGNYLIGGLGSGAYTITPSKSGDVNGSISGLDAARVAQHVAGLITLTPSQQIAGDATNNGSLSGLDAARIAQFAAGLANPGVAGQWKFAPPFRSYPSVTGAVTGQNYEAILVGDVTGNWTPASPRPRGYLLPDPPAYAKPSLERSRESADSDKSIRLTLPEVIVGKADKSLTVSVTVDETAGREILAYDFAVSYDPEKLVPDPSTNWAAGTLSSEWSMVVNTDVPGRIKVTAFGTAPLSGSGVLLDLSFRKIGSGDPETRLFWSMFELNEGRVPVDSPPLKGPVASKYPRRPSTTDGRKPLKWLSTDDDSALRPLASLLWLAPAAK